MTISEQLRFSILSAPLAQTDRRVLSQAWYSALCRSRSKRGGTPVLTRPSFQNSRTPARTCTRSTAFAPSFLVAPCSGSNSSTANLRAVPERRAPRSELARKIGVLAAQRTTRKRAAATFVVDETGARVRVLVAVKNSNVRLIAVCAKHLEKTVARALAQARYDAATSGLHLSVDVRGAQ